MSDTALPGGVSECLFASIPDLNVTHCLDSRIDGDPLFGYHCTFQIGRHCWRVILEPHGMKQNQT